MSTTQAGFHTGKQPTVTVYCASSADIAPIYIESARALGRALAQRGIRIITGAGQTGLMGAVADGALAAGGHVKGIIPQFMVERGWAHRALTELMVVPDMHTRKKTMAAEAAACIALPGGIGTFEELLEIITWRQLGLYGGKVIIYNMEDYYGPLISMLAKAQQQGFMRPGSEVLYTVAGSLQEVLENI